LRGNDQGKRKVRRGQKVVKRTGVWGRKRHPPPDCRGFETPSTGVWEWAAGLILEKQCLEEKCSDARFSLEGGELVRMDSGRVGKKKVHNTPRSSL